MFAINSIIAFLNSAVHINDKPYMGEGDVVAGIGEMQRMQVRVSCVASSSTSPFGFPAGPDKVPVIFKGELALRCFQDLQNGKAPVDRMENLIICGVQRRPFNLKLNNEADKVSNYKKLITQPFFSNQMKSNSLQTYLCSPQVTLFSSVQKESTNFARMFKLGETRSQFKQTSSLFLMFLLM